MCNNIINKFENVIYVGIIDKNAKLLVGKGKNFENDMIIEGITSQSYLPNTYEIYNVLKNMNNKLSQLSSDDFSYIVIKKNKFKLIVIPLLPNKTKSICIFIIISDKSIKNLISKILKVII